MLISGTVKLAVSDFEKSVNFYMDILGFKLNERIGRVWAKIEKSGLTLEIRPVPARGKKKKVKPNISLGVGVSDFDAALLRLKENKVPVSKFKDDENSRIVLLSDPDGISIYLREIT